MKASEAAAEQLLQVSEKLLAQLDRSASTQFMNLDLEEFRRAVRQAREYHS